jgi:hypothetical protein
MPVLKELSIAGPVLFLLLLLSDALIGPAATQSLTNRRAWIGAEQVPAERWLFKDSIATCVSWEGTYPFRAEPGMAKTAAVRVRDVFAQFVPGQRSRQG